MSLLLIAVAVLAAVATDASGFASRVASTWPPEKYRYTGWLSPGTGDRPLHAVVQGDTFVLNFVDAGTLGGTRYRVCWSHPDDSSRRCATRVGHRLRVSRVTVSEPRLRFGRYVARWYVHGRVVASWPFVYGPSAAAARPRP